MEERNEEGKETRKEEGLKNILEEISTPDPSTEAERSKKWMEEVGNKMKTFEKEFQTTIDPSKFFCVRLDGHHFRFPLSNLNGFTFSLF